MNWKYVKPLTNDESINEYQRLVDHIFTSDFIDIVRLYNGGRPESRNFITNTSQERMLKSLLSFNKDDLETVWLAFNNLDETYKDRYVPFAVDNFGNLVCFVKNSDNIIFLDHETLNSEYICESFNTFLKLLY